MDHLPAELPTKDELAPLQPVAAPAEEVAAPMSEEQLVDSLIGLPWEFIINKDARQEWARMDRPFRSATSAAVTTLILIDLWQLLAYSLVCYRT